MACFCFNLLWYLKKRAKKKQLFIIIIKAGLQWPLRKSYHRAREADRFLRRRVAKFTYSSTLRKFLRNTLIRHQASPKFKVQWGLRVRVCAALRWSSRWKTYSPNISRSLNLSKLGDHLWGSGHSLLGQPRDIYLELRRLLRSMLQKE